MSEKEKLPIGWEESKIGEVCEPSQYGYTAKARDKGNYHYLRTTDITKKELNWDNVPFCEISEEEAEKYLLKDNDVVISRAGSIGYSYLISKARKSVFASYLIRFRPLLNPRYFRYFLDSQQYWSAISEGSSGIAVQNVNAKTLSLIGLPIAPEKEQQRIVEKLDETFSELDVGVKELKSAQIKLNQYRQSLLKSAVEGSLTQQWREENLTKVQENGEQLLARILKQRREQWQQQKLAEFNEKGKKPPKGWQDKYPEPVQPDTTDLPGLPEGWVWATIAQIASVGTGVTPLKSRTDFYHNGDIPWVTSGAVNDENVYEASTLITQTAIDECRLKVYPAGTLLVAMYGEGKTRGMSAELKIPATINQALAALTLEENAFALKEFLKIFLLDSYQKMRSQASGGVQPNLNLMIVRSMCVPIPPISEQKKIFQLFQLQTKEIKSQEKLVKFSLDASEAQRKNILKSAFSGRLVPQDPNDEPASILLEKIKAEREALAKIPKTKKFKRKPVMKKIAIDEVAKWVGDYKGDGFTFEELQKAFKGDYDQLKDCVFEMLSAKKPLFKQEFDQKIGSMRFVKENK